MKSLGIDGKKDLKLCASLEFDPFSFNAFIIIPSAIEFKGTNAEGKEITTCKTTDSCIGIKFKDSNLAIYLEGGLDYYYKDNNDPEAKLTMTLYFELSM